MFNDQSFYPLLALRLPRCRENGSLRSGSLLGFNIACCIHRTACFAYLWEQDVYQGQSHWLFMGELAQKKRSLEGSRREQSLAERRCRALELLSRSSREIEPPVGGSIWRQQNQERAVHWRSRELTGRREKLQRPRARRGESPLLGSRRGQHRNQQRPNCLWSL